MAAIVDIRHGIAVQRLGMERTGIERPGRPFPSGVSVSRSQSAAYVELSAKQSDVTRTTENQKHTRAQEPLACSRALVN